MASVSTTVKVNTTVSNPARLSQEVVNRDHFGANLVGTDWGISHASSEQIPGKVENYLEQVQLAMNAINYGVDSDTVSILRYPAGKAEGLLSLDLGDFNSVHHLSGGDGNGGIVSPGQFLDFCQANNADMTFVLPTHQFVSGHYSSSPTVLTNLINSEVRPFLQKLLSEALAHGVTIKAIEVGNEWWNTNSGDMSALAYGRVASHLALVVQEEINRFKSDQGLPSGWGEPKILIQLGNKAGSYDTNAIDDIILGFNQSAERKAVDGVLLHHYLQEGFDKNDANPGNPGAEYPVRQFDYWDDKTSSWVTGKSYSRYVTEWNVAMSNQDELGLRGAANIIGMFAQMIRSGVDQSSIWPILANSDNSLWMRSGWVGNGSAAKLSIVGETFSLLNESLRGTRYVELETPGNPDNNILAQSRLGIEAFQDAKKTILFVSNISESTNNVNLDVGNLVGSYHHVWGVVLGANPNPDDPKKVDPWLLVKSGGDLDHVDGQVNFQLQSEQTIRLVFTRGDIGVRMIGHDYDDSLVGSKNGDKILGKDGSDTLVGGADNDTLNGGSGNDSLQGNTGDDTLFGGEGNNVIIGGSGGDKLYCGSGNDSILGGSGDDSLFSGAGKDTLIGGRGCDFLQDAEDTSRDVFVFLAVTDSVLGADRDKIVNFTPGIDDVDLSGIDANSVVSGNQIFTFNNKTPAPNGVWYVKSGSNVVVRGDVNGDAVQDFEVEIKGIAVLSNTDFIL